VKCGTERAIFARDLAIWPMSGAADDDRWIMKLRVSAPIAVRLTEGPLRVTGLLLLGVAYLSACDVGYPTSQWDAANVDHAVISNGFELVGVHEDALCSGCHQATDYALKYQPANNQDCQACHMADYEAKHGPLGYPTTCTLCHTPTDWGDGSFDHTSASGGFNLWGPHLELPCTACHIAGSWQVRFDPEDSSDCGACH